MTQFISKWTNNIKIMYFNVNVIILLKKNNILPWFYKLCQYYSFVFILLLILTIFV